MTRYALAFALAVTCLSPVLEAQTTRVVLDPDESRHLVGCYDPCDCLLALYPDVSGSFDYSFIGFDPAGNSVFGVTNVEWFVPSVGIVLGSGTYLGFPTALPRHQMDLDLTIDGGPLMHLDSEVQVMTKLPPEFAIQIADNDWDCFNHVFELDGDESVGSPYCDALPNSTGLPARIAAFGTDSIAQNDLVLQAAPVPAGQPGIFYYGPNAAQIAFGDGFRCVTGNAFRLFPPSLGDAQGRISHALDMTNPPGGPGAGGLITAGSTWRFQGWYRDPAAMASGFNLSDGLAVTFAP